MDRGGYSEGKEEIAGRLGRHAGRGALDSTLRFSARRAGAGGRMEIIFPHLAELGPSCILYTVENGDAWCIELQCQCFKETTGG